MKVDDVLSKVNRIDTVLRSVQNKVNVIPCRNSETEVSLNYFDEILDLLVFAAAYKDVLLNMEVK